jgi:hypothetical protein
MHRVWFSSRIFPTPGIPVLVRLDDGTELKAIRSDYVKSYKDDPKFTNITTGETIKNVDQWAIY